MATHAVTRSASGTLTANTVDTVTLSDNASRIQVTNRSGASEIYFSIDGTTPTVGGDDTFILPAAIGSRVVSSDDVGVDITTVKLISTGTPTYSVEAL